MKKYLVEFIVKYDYQNSEIDHNKARKRIVNEAKSMALKAFLFNNDRSP